jgi:hypothetical protein
MDSTARVRQVPLALAMLLTVPCVVVGAVLFAGQDQADAVAGRWDGLGADGFQAVDRLEDRTMAQAGGGDYRFTPGTFYRVDAAGVINDVPGQPLAGAYSDIRKVPVAELIVAAAAHGQ